MFYRDDPRYNASGYKDPTAYEALKRIEDEERDLERRKRRVIHLMLNIADLAGFTVESRIVLSTQPRRKKDAEI